MICDWYQRLVFESKLKSKFRMLIFLANRDWPISTSILIQFRKTAILSPFFFLQPLTKKQIHTRHGQYGNVEIKPFP